MEFIELNETKAKEWYAKEYRVSVEEVMGYPYYKTLQGVFERLYLDEGDTHQQVIDLCKWMSQIDIQDVVETGAKTIADYLALGCERLEKTPYGYLMVKL